MGNYLDIPGYEGLYSISKDGDILSRKRKKTILLKHNTEKNGYRSVILCKDGSHKRLKVHRLVMLTYLGFSDMEVNHIDGDVSNNNIRNLEYCTRSENMKHLYSVLGKVGPCKGKLGILHPGSVKVIQIDSNGSIIKERGSMKDAERGTGISQSHISRSCNGFNRKAGGFFRRKIK